MKILDCIEDMSKSYLDKVINSFSKDINKFDEFGARDFIAKNIREITQSAHINKRVETLQEYPFKDRVLMKEILNFLLMKTDYSTPEINFYDDLRRSMRESLKRYKNKEVLSNIDKNKIELVRTVYEVILEDDKLSADEERILTAIRKKLNLTQVETNNIMATTRRMDENYNFSNLQIEEGLKELQKLGIVYYLNLDVKEKKFVIPEEIASTLAKSLNYPLNHKTFSILLDDISKESLYRFAKNKKVSVVGSKETIINRLWAQGHSAHDVLNSLTKEELVKLAGQDKGIKTSGSKDDLTRMLLKYFFKVNSRVPGNSASESNLWEYYPDFANRNYGLLRELGIIERDLECEHNFEELTKYAFNKTGRLKLLKFEGNNNPDGGAFEENTGNVLLWDNKSQETPYTLPLNHQKQFLQYVIKSKKPVLSFLIITGKIEETKKVENCCIRLSGETKVNIGVISAKTFKEFLDDYAKTSNDNPLNLQIFNHNGVITNKVLEIRSSILK